MRRLATVRAVSVLVVAGALLAGCGSSDSGQSDRGGAGAGFAAAFTAYRSCMSDHGVTLPDFGDRPGGVRPSGAPTGRPSQRPSWDPSARPSGAPTGMRAGRGFEQQKPDGVSEKAWQAALSACQSLLPQRSISPS